MDRSQPRNVAGFCFTVLLSISMLSIDGDAQTNRRKPTAKATPTPARTTEPVIISRADDYPTVVIEPAPLTTDQTQPSSDATIEELRERLLQLEARSNKKDPDEKQRRLSLNLDILTKSEQRSDSLRKQLFDMIEKENTIRGRMDQIDNDLRPESIERAMAIVGSLRPEDLRAQRRRSLELEKSNLQALLTEVQKNRANLDINLQRSDALVEKLRVRIESEIEIALADDATHEKKPLE